MKMKLAVAFAVLLFATLARADSTPITVNATAISCQAACDQPFEPALDFQAQLTVQQTTGQFFDSGGIGLFTGTEYEVTSLTGTLNGSPVTLAAPPFGIGSWLYFEPDGQIELGDVYFTANGSYDWLENDNTNDLLEISDPNDGEPNNIIAWNAVDPTPAVMPEPPSSLLLGIGLAALLSLFGKLKNAASD
jgi:hypothetical protein